MVQGPSGNASGGFISGRSRVACATRAERGPVFRPVSACSSAVTLLALIVAGGCQSHLNQQLLERELRLQEDQIYRLQDVLDEKMSRLEHVVQENVSLRRQLGYSDGQASRGAVSQPAAGPRSRSGPPTAGGSGPLLVPPTIDLSEPGAAPAPRAPSSPSAAPPTLEGVPPLPESPPSTGLPATRDSDAPAASAAIPEVTLPSSDALDDPGAEFPGTDDGPSFEPVFGTPQAAAPRMLDAEARQATALLPPGQARSLSSPNEGGIIEQLSYAQPALLTSAAGTPERIVINRELTGLVDADGDGVAEGVSIVFEPRDAAERLVEAVGDVSVAIHEAAVTATPPLLASWSVPALEVTSTFRRTSRSRGIRLLLPWPGRPPHDQGGTVHVRLVTADGRSFDADAPISFDSHR
jgi:hypothetical protein